MLVRKRLPQVDQDGLFLYVKLHRQSLLGVPVAILDVGIQGNCRLRTRYTKNVQSLCAKEAGIRQVLVIP